MRKLKKIFAFMLCSVMLLAGCGDGEKNDTDRKTENDTQSQSDEVDSQEASSDDRVQIDNFE